jgi:hypothetical protein
LVRLSKHVPDCPPLLVTVQVTDVGESTTLKVDPSGGLHEVEEPSELVAENDTTAAHIVASFDCVMSLGHVMVSG